MFLHHQPRRAAITATVRKTEARRWPIWSASHPGLKTGTAAADCTLGGILEGQGLPEVRAA